MTGAPTKVVLLACGSFNPITNMHLRMFELARDALHRTGKYNVISGIISPVSDGYQKKDLVAQKHRCAMVEKAIETAKWIRMDTWECEQQKWSETAKVLAYHKAKLDNQYNTNINSTPSKKRRKCRKNEEELERIGNMNNSARNEKEGEGVSLKLLCGGDLLESFAVPGLWKDEDIEEIVSKYGLVCITRSGSDPKQFIYESDVLYKHQDNIHIVTEWITNDVSATKIRRALRRGESIKYLVQDPVIEYIQKNQLYGVPDNKYIEHCLPSPLESSIIPMDCVDGNVASETPPPESPNIAITQQSLRASPRSSVSVAETSSAPRSPRRMMEEEEEGDTKVPRSPRGVPCMTDIGTLVRRVRNVRIGFTPETRVFAFAATETCV